MQPIVNSDFYNNLCKTDNLPPRMVLFTKGRRRSQVGHYGILESNGEVVDMGTSIDVLPLARRPKAIDMSNMTVLTVNYDFESDEFKRIAAQSLEGGKKGSGGKRGQNYLFCSRASRSCFPRPAARTDG
jgi:NAD-dependent SIR2 family protein deacetylase